MRKQDRGTQREHLQAVLREARLQPGLTQPELARRIGRPQSFVSKYESGERRLDILELRQICQALGLSLTTLVRRLEKLLA
ncbi:MAG: helix-turn-helix transcriptional regulator [Actinomycetota bacterium]